jgi:uncharacterized delta-60 repeat protein
MKYLYISVLLFCVSLFCGSLLFGQAPDTAWTLTFGGTSNDQGFSGIQTSDGGYLVGGWSQSFGAGGQDIYLIKLDSLGGTQWTKTIGGGYNDLVRSIQELSGGGYIMVGRTSSFGSGNWDVYLLRLNANGDTVWTRTYGGSSDDRGNCVQVTSDGGFIIAGETRSYGAGENDAYLIKTNSSGSIDWQYTFGGSDNDRAFSVVQTSDGGYILTGHTESSGAGYYDVFTVKTDSLGISQWEKTCGGIGNDRGYGVLETSGGYIIAGFTTSFGAGQSDVYLIKTYANGDTNWTNTFGGLDWDRGYSLIELPNGEFVIAGFTHSIGAGDGDIYLLKSSPTGSLVWSEAWGGVNNEEANSVILTSDGGYLITGFTASFGAGGEDVYILKTNPDQSFVNEDTPIKESQYSVSCSPNPAGKRVFINYALSNSEDVEIHIFNLLGQNVKTITCKRTNKGKYSLEWNTKNQAGEYVPKGLYFVKFKAGKYSETHKLLIIQ